MPFVFDRKLFLWLFTGFILFTVVGTLSHEAGHYLVGKLQGRDSMRIAYAYTTHGVYAADDRFTELARVHYEDINNGRHFPEEDEYNALQKQVERNAFFFTLGGPLQTMLFGSIGFVTILLSGKRFRSAKRLCFGQWLLVFLALFWLREATNLFMILARLLVTGHYKMRADEFGLALYLRWHPWSVQVICGIIALIVAAVVTFRYVPLRQRFTFVAAVLAGGVCGYILWLETLGPVLLP